VAEKVMIGVKFAPEVIAAIDTAAGKREINRSEFVRRCVARVLAAENDSALSRGVARGVAKAAPETSAAVRRVVSEARGSSSVASNFKGK